MSPDSASELPLLLLIHGAWHTGNCWQSLIPHLQAKGLRCLAPDLPGHGKNLQADGRISLNSYSRYISQITDNKRNIILIGHSMAGMLISQLAEAHPERISLLVYLNAYLPQDGQSLFDLMKFYRLTGEKAAIENALQYSEDKRFCSLLDEAIIPLFYNCCADSLQQSAKAQIQPQASLPLAGRVKLSTEKFGSIPKVYIHSLQDRVIPAAQSRQMLAANQSMPVYTLDTDHSPFYSQPESLARLLSSLVNENSSC